MTPPLPAATVTDAAPPAPHAEQRDRAPRPPQFVGPALDAEPRASAPFVERRATPRIAPRALTPPPPQRAVPPANAGPPLAPELPPARVESQPVTRGRTPDAPPTPPADPVSPAPARRVNPFLANDPSQKARRLARALVSDLVVYQPQKREEGLRAGTLKELFRDEIRKSWEEYVAQVGAPLAQSTTHFQDALNDVLAGGRKIF